MNPSLFLAKLLGPYCLIVAIGVLVNLKIYKRMFEDLAKNRAMFYLAGIFALFFGLLIVLFYIKNQSALVIRLLMLFLLGVILTKYGYFYVGAK